MELNEKDLIAAVRDFALDNYNSAGWDILVECWDDEDIIEVIDGAKTVKAALSACAEILTIRDDFRADICAA